jgi:DNA transformation protein and related proteins
MSPPTPRNPLAALPNLGPKSAAMLQQAGIPDLAHLRAMGSVRAYQQVKRCTPSATLNLLWALEGALTQTPWRVVAREQRIDLLLALDALQQGTR